MTTEISDADRAKARAAPKDLTADALLARMVALCHERRGEDVVSLDVRGLVEYMDHLLLVSGRSARQNRALAEHLQRTLKREHKMLALSRSGMDAGTWICLDYVDVVVHIFDEESRAHYDLELLWADAKRTEHEAPEGAAPADEDEPVDDGVIRPE